MTRTKGYKEMSGALAIVDERGVLSKRWHAPPYNEEYAAIALNALHDGITLRECCRTQQKTNPRFPNPSVIYAWATDNTAGFASRYAHARRAQALHWAEEIVEIAEDGTNDYIERRKLDGTIVKIVDSECVQRSKLRVDTRKWLLSKLCPEFADRVQHQTLGANGVPVDPPSAVAPIDLSIALRGWKPKE
jgi:hypothetical protein